MPHCVQCKVCKRKQNDKCKHSINSIYYLPVVHRRCIILYIHTFMYNIHKQTNGKLSQPYTHTCHTQTDHRKCPCASSTSWRISFMYGIALMMHLSGAKMSVNGIYSVQMSTHHHLHHHQSILLMLVQSPVSPGRPAWSSCLSGLRQWSSTLLVRFFKYFYKTLMFTKAAFIWPKSQHKLSNCEINLPFEISFLTELRLKKRYLFQWFKAWFLALLIQFLVMWNK